MVGVDGRRDHGARGRFQDLYDAPWTTGWGQRWAMRRVGNWGCQRIVLEGQHPFRGYVKVYASTAVPMFFACSAVVPSF